MRNNKIGLVCFMAAFPVIFVAGCGHETAGIHPWFPAPLLKVL
jgi:hypothetical protein